MLSLLKYLKMLTHNRLSDSALISTFPLRGGARTASVGRQAKRKSGACIVSSDVEPSRERRPTRARSVAHDRWAAPTVRHVHPIRVSVNVADDRDRDVEVVTQISSGDHRFWFLDIPQDSKLLRLVVAVHQGRTVEFIVKPPRPPSATE